MLLAVDSLVFDVGVVVWRSHAVRCAERLASHFGVTVVGRQKVSQSGEMLFVRSGGVPSDLARNVAHDPVMSWVAHPLVLDRRATTLCDVEELAAPGARVRIASTCPAEVAAILETLSDALLPWEFAKSNYDTVLSAIRCAGGVAYGVGPAEALTARGLAGGQRFAASLRRIRNLPDRVASRSYFKLDEALWRYGTEPGGTACDLGAAPGGWTQRLAESCDRVVAVDPANLHIPPHDTRRHECAIDHVQLVFEKALPGLLTTGALDVLVCDMCLYDASDAVNAVFSLAPAIAKGALLVIAIKIPSRGKGAETRDILARPIADRLTPYLDDARLFHLFCSTERERTLVGRWRGMLPAETESSATTPLGPT
ncbi:hypothetical protein CTAYLR_004787 [Chrysophaeum taylorii]|uniref:Ribosomal RNA methyltransferase FtsJ domain-containing protein n=1 Tax=Chrysophaeum taylorii TaxID=2483200 RepID=A0AAD7UQ14_9STRA|nr:hypothetical protein CTAYLR_004787 [Chrysophaeum taylorii]